MTKRSIRHNESQLSLPFSSRGTAGSAASSALSYDNRQRFFWTLASACLLSLGLYIYAVNATAHNVAMRAALETEASSLNANLATLEFRYISLKNEVTLETARQYGFTEVKEPTYVSREASASSLSFNTQTR